MVFEWYREELLCAQLVEPVCEGTIRLPEGIIVLFDCFLIGRIRVRGSESGNMLEVGQWVHTFALARVYSGHRPAINQLRCFISQRDDVVMRCLEVEHVGILPYLFDV